MQVIAVIQDKPVINKILKSVGEATGAVVGGGIAAATGGDGWTGAAIGAIAGGIVGNIKGKEAE